MIDARGLSCPMPVTMVFKEVRDKNPDIVEVLVDERVAVENITRLAENNSYDIFIEDMENEFKLTLKKKV